MLSLESTGFGLLKSKADDVALAGDDVALAGEDTATDGVTVPTPNLKPPAFDVANVVLGVEFDVIMLVFPIPNENDVVDLGISGLEVATSSVEEA